MHHSTHTPSCAATPCPMQAGGARAFALPADLIAQRYMLPQRPYGRFSNQVEHRLETLSDQVLQVCVVGGGLSCSATRRWQQL